MSELTDLIRANYDIILDNVISRLLETVPIYRQFNQEQTRQLSDQALNLILADLDSDNGQEYYNYNQDIAYSRAKRNIPIKVMLDGLDAFMYGIIDNIYPKINHNSNVVYHTMTKIHKTIESGIRGMYDGYQRAQEETIIEQNRALSEVSTPIVPIFQGILVIPIVGSIDSHRAGQIMEALLEQIGQTSADIVILDITGVPIIDTSVANYLLHAARAARLLGSNVVLVGIGPEIAQTIIQLGIDLTGITTRANLQSGIEYALNTRGLVIRKQ